MLGDRIRYYRKQSGLTQKELATRLGVTNSAVSQWELGTVTNVQLDTIHKMANLFGCTPADLLGIEPTPNDVRTQLLELVHTLTDDEIGAVLTLLKRK